MDRGRAARGGQKPTTPTTRLIKGYSRINAYYATRLDLRPMSETVRATITAGIAPAVPPVPVSRDSPAPSSSR